MPMKIERSTLKLALLAKGYQLQMIARELEVTPTLVSSVLAGRAKSRRVEDRIASILNRGAWEIWDYREEDTDME